MTSFSEVVNSLNADEPRANIAAIKGAVKEQLHATDTRVQVDVTDHFNHSFVPDLLLSWPGTKETRSVFLRTAFREEEIRRDIDVLGRERPILMSLDRLPEDQRKGDALQTQAKASNSLVADPYGLEVFDEESESRPVVTLLSHAVLQGGRGVMSSASARSSGQIVDAGFDAARTGDAEITSVAVDDAADLLDSYRASQINRLLHAVWVGSGRSGSSFPGAAGLTASLDAESLRFILQLPGIDDEDFWARIGVGLTTNRICELIDFPASANLQRLVSGSAHKLMAKACRIIRGSGDYADYPKWSVGGGTLVMSIEEERLHFAPSTVDQLPAPLDDPPEVSVGELQERAQVAELRLGEVRLSDGAHVMSYGAEDDADVARSEALASMQALMSNAELTSATAFADGREVRCVFRTRTAAGNSSAKFLISDLVGVALPLLVAPSSHRADAVRSMLDRPAGSGSVPTTPEIL